MTSANPFQTVVTIVLDSLRHDSFALARTPVMDRLMKVQEGRHSYATWTLPSHSCLLAGLLPFPRSHGEEAATIYAKDLDLWSATLSGDGDRNKLFAPHFSLAEAAKSCGFATYASMAMPILNRHSNFTRGFDTYEDSTSVTALRFAAQAESALFCLNQDKPNFIFINVGDTHYPYLLPPSEMPRISGLHGASKIGSTEGHQFSADTLKAMHDSQIKAVEAIDRWLDHFLAELPKPARVFVISDHGELFGEDGLFGHGPYPHPLLLDVPFATGDIT